jgi:molybdopterin converting factor small subunit
VIHTTERVGVLKVESAQETIRALNPDVNVQKYPVRLGPENIMDILPDYDIIVDGLDNFPTRYLLNDASVRLRIPVVSAAILGFDGQLSVFAPYEGPCYRCLFATPPPPELAPSCGANGVLGVLPGTMGLLQATEVIKLIIGAGEPAIGRLLMYDALAATIRIPPVLRPSVGGERELSASGSSVGEILRSVADTHPATQTQLFASDGELNRYVNVYLNDEDVRVLDGLDTAVSESDTLVILPAMAGGAGGYT